MGRLLHPKRRRARQHVVVRQCTRSCHILTWRYRCHALSMIPSELSTRQIVDTWSYWSTGPRLQRTACSTHFSSRCTVICVAIWVDNVGSGIGPVSFTSGCHQAPCSPPLSSSFRHLRGYRIRMRYSERTRIQRLLTSSPCRRERF